MPDRLLQVAAMHDRHMLLGCLQLGPAVHELRLALKLDLSCGLLEASLQGRTFRFDIPPSAVNDVSGAHLQRGLHAFFEETLSLLEFVPNRVFICKYVLLFSQNARDLGRSVHD